MPRKDRVCTTPPSISDRIVALRRVKAAEMQVNLHNFCTHPAAQYAALRGLLVEIGYADALIAYTTDDGALEPIAEHLRAEDTPNQEVLVLVTDLSEAEAKLLLAIRDPLAAMAGTQDQQLDRLLPEVKTGDAAVQAMLVQLVDKSRLYAPPSRLKRCRQRHTADEATPVADQTLSDDDPSRKVAPAQGYVVRVRCRDQAHQHEVYDWLAAEGYRVRLEAASMVRPSKVAPDVV